MNLDGGILTQKCPVLLTLSFFRVTKFQPPVNQLKNGGNGSEKHAHNETRMEILPANEQCYQRSK